MELYFTDHALDRMASKRIAEQMVESVLANPAWSPATTRGIRYDGTIDGRRLAVVIDERPRVAVTMITVFWVGDTR